MAKKIKDTDIFEGGVKKLQKQVNGLSKEVGKLQTSLLELAKTSKAIKLSDDGGYKKLQENQKKVVKTTKQLTAVQKEEIKLQKKLQSSTAKLVTSQTKEAQSLQQVQTATQKQSQASRKLTRFQQAEKGSINQLNAANAILRQRRNAVSAATDKGRAKIDKLNRVIDRNTVKTRKMSDAMTKQKMNIGNYGSALGKLRQGFSMMAMKVVAVVAAFKAVGRVLGAAMKSYDQQIKAQKSLEVALGGVSTALLRQASALQAKTKFGDEAIIQGQAFLAQMGLTEREIKKVTPAILDFAEAQGINANDAFKLVAKSLGSSTNALSRYGIEITGAVGSNERLESAVGNLAAAFEGQAEAAAEVGTGSLVQLQNALGDTQEAHGRLIAMLVGAGGMTEALSKTNDQFNLFIDNLEKGTIKIDDIFNPVQAIKNAKAIIQANELSVKVIEKLIEEEMLFNKEGKIKVDVLKKTIAAMAKSNHLSKESAVLLVKETTELAKEQKKLNDAKKVRIESNEVIKETIDLKKLLLETDEDELEVLGLEYETLKEIEDKKNRLNDARRISNELSKEYHEEEMARFDEINKKEAERLAKKQASEAAMREVVKITFDYFKTINAAKIKEEEFAISRNDKNIEGLERRIGREMTLVQSGAAADIQVLKDKVEAEKALRDENIKDREKAVKQQQALQLIEQIGNLVTAISQIYAAESKAGVWGVIAASIGVVSMLAAYTTQKSQAQSLETGGVIKDGVVRASGKRHSSGGEPLSDYVEVEGGEDIGILNRTASSKYGDMFRDITNQMNTDDFDINKADNRFMINTVQMAYSERLLQLQVDEMKGMRKDLNDHTEQLKNMPYHLKGKNGEDMFISPNKKSVYV